jgi:tetratricopeptide (TPR) repeat protein
MNSFVWKGKDSEGEPRCERVSAENAQAAKTILAAQGWSDLQLVMDEICDNAGKMVQGPESADELRERLGPEGEVRFLEARGPGFWCQYRQTLFQLKGAIILLLLSTGWGIYTDRTWLMVVGTTGLGCVLVLFPVIHLFFSLPMQYYVRLNKAKVWSRWDEVLLCVERLRQAHRLTRIGVGELELARCRAQALAATGRLEQAVKEFSQFANDPNIPRWNYLSFLGGIYDSSKEYEKAFDCRREAATENPDCSALWIDLAYGLVHGLNRPSEAREALARAEALETPALGVPYLSFLRGVIYWREARFAEAREHLEKALPGFKSYEHNPLVEGLVLLTKSYLCAVVGALGDLDAARIYFRQAEEFLVAAEEAELLEACRRSLFPTTAGSR